MKLRSRKLLFSLRPALIVMALGLGTLQCQTSGELQPPPFDYGRLAARYIAENPGGHFPVTIQRGSNLQAVSSLTGHMFYTSNVLGSGDIWIRDLGKTVSVALVRHPAEQYKPAVPPTGDRLVFVSEDSDPRGDLRLVTLEAPQIIRNALNGVPNPDLWESTVNLSESIAALAQEQNMPAACQGPAAETDPVWNHTGTLLAFASDRCNPGEYRLWMLEMDEETPIALTRLTERDAVQPRFGPESKHIVFLSFRDSPGGRVYTAGLIGNRLLRGSVREVALPGNNASTTKSGQVYQYANPILARTRDLRTNELRDGLTLYYTSIRRDTNGNNRLDSGDRGGIYAYELSANGEERPVPNSDTDANSASIGAHQSTGERQLLDAGATLLSAAYTDLVGGTILYAAQLYNSVNLYFLEPRGIIPLEADIERQFNLRIRYLVESHASRYPLALNAVKEYYGDEPEYLAYAGKVELERARYYASRGQQAEADRVRLALARSAARNPIAKLQLDLADTPAPARQATRIRRFIQETTENPEPYTEIEAQAVLAAALRLLATTLEESNQLTEALAALTQLDERYPGYHLRDQALLQQGRISARLNLIRLQQASDEAELAALPLVPAVYSTLLAELRQRPCPNASRPASATAEQSMEPNNQCASDRARKLETLHADLYDLFYEQRTPAEAAELAEFVLNRPRTGEGEEPVQLDPFIRLSWLTIRARALFDEKRYLDALNESTAILSQLPGAAQQQPAPGWRSMYIRAWQITSYVQEQLGNFSEAYAAKLNYGGAYSRETVVDIDTQDFLDIIEESESFIDLYLRTAREIYATVKENESVVLGETIGAAIDSVTNEAIDIGGTEMDVLYEFCQPSSRNRVLFLSLGPSYDERYVNFCRRNFDILSARDFTRFPVKSARSAADLLFIASYANTSILNIMFLNIKRLGVLEDLYDERAVYYQRLKIDIAAEKNKKLLESRTRDLLVLGQADLTTLISERDPYDSQTYDELIFGYRNALPTASAVGDLSLIYGYAYILIKKNTEREAFYDQLQNEAYANRDNLIQGLAPGGIRLPQNLLIEKKEEILRDFKHADYLLQYILNVDPLNTDAYLLRGWLYQYIDERRGRSVRAVPSFLENIYYYLTRSQPISQSDGRFYADVYKNYFPDNLYESNVESYRQALQKLETSAPSQAVGNLHLNLGNNYFKLLNFQRAVEHYERAETLLLRAAQNTRTTPFDSYKRHALFHFNMGRALFYVGSLDGAAKRFQKAYDIYDEFERKPLHERFSTLSFLLNNSQNAGLSLKERRIQRQKIETTLEQSEAVRLKMALIAAMIGLAHWEAGRPDDAVLFYQDAILRLYDNSADSGLSSSGSSGIALVERASLMNFIALAHQSQRNFSESDERATEAGRYARDRGLLRDDLRYEPQTLGGRALGCILPYGEDFSIIGAGRTPYGFSPLRQYHLSLGIQLENRIQQGDLEGASYLLRQRRQAFQARDMDVRLGRQGFVATLNQEALNDYRAGDYEAAAERFREAAERSRDFDFLISFRQNYYNYFKALFADIEAREQDSNRNSPELDELREASLQKVADGLDEISDFRDEYRDELRDQFIAARTAEIPGYEFDEERDGPALRQKLNEQLLDILSIEGTLYYYQGRLRATAARNRETLRLTNESFERALQLYDAAFEVLPAPRNAPAARRALRLRINHNRLLIASGDLPTARKALRTIIEDAYEFNFIREEWLARSMLAGVYAELFAVHKQADDRASAREQYAAAAQILREQSELYPGLRRHLPAFYQTASDFFIRIGEPDTALELQESSWEQYLSWQFYRNPLRFANQRYQQDYDLVRESRQRLRELNASEAALRFQRKKFDSITERKRRRRAAMGAALRSMNRLRPRLATFSGMAFARAQGGQVVPPKLRRPELSDARQTVLRLYYFPGEPVRSQTDAYLAAWCFRGSSAPTFQRLPLASDAGAGPLREAVTSSASACFRGRASGERFVIPAPGLYQLDLAGLIAESTGERPGYSTRLSDDFVGFLNRGARSQKLIAERGLHIYNSRTALVFNSDRRRHERADIVGLSAWYNNALFPAGDELLFDPREWLSDQRSTSMALVYRGKPAKSRGARPDYQRDAAIYEVFRASGTGTVAFVDSPADQAIDAEEVGREVFADFERVASMPPGRAPATAQNVSTDANTARADALPPTESAAGQRVREILQARGSLPLSAITPALFGSSGHARRDFEQRLLRDHVSTRRAAESAESAGNLHLAARRFALAESYLQSHPREAQIRFENDLGLARLQLRESGPGQTKQTAQTKSPGSTHFDPARTARFDAMLQRYSDNPAKLPRVYDTLIETLLVETLPHIARRYLAEYISRFPDRKDEIIRKNALLSFQARVRGREYGDSRRENQRFTRDFHRVRNQILASPDALEFVSNLSKHAQFDLAGRLSLELGRRASTRDEAALLRLTNAFNRHMLSAGQVGRSAKPPINATKFSQRSANLETNVLATVLAGYNGDWTRYRRRSDVIEATLRRTNRLALGKFRARLFEQWRNHLEGRAVNLLDIANVSLRDAQTAYGSVSQLERSMLYELLVTYLKYDPELQMARMMDRLLVGESAVSTNRASRMAIGAAEAFISLHDNATALRYLQRAVDLADNAIPDAALSARLSRVGLSVHAAGLLGRLNNNRSGWTREESESARKRREEAWRERLLNGWQKLQSPEVQALFAYAAVDTSNQSDADIVKRIFDLNDILRRGEKQAMFQAQLPIALGILKAKAVQTEKWPLLLELSFLEQEFANARTARRRGISISNPQLHPLTLRLMQKLPQNQSFVALADTPDAAVRISYRDRRWEGVRLKQSGRMLRGRMYQYLIRSQQGDQVQTLREELSRQYRALFGIGNTGTTYYWLGDVHALAPILPERGDQLYQMLNPRAMLATDRQALPSGDEYPENFSVRLVEDRQRGVDYATGDSALFFERLKTMERVSLGSTLHKNSRNERAQFAPRQITRTITPTRNPHLSDESSATGAWFYSGNRLGLSPQEEVENLNYLLAYLGSTLQGPGVLTLRTPRTLDHARFLRTYYNRSLPARAIYRRYQNAAFNLRRTGGDFDYRLVTANFLGE